jgi:hypothetical protein
MSKNASKKVQINQSRAVLSDWIKEYFLERGAKYELKVRKIYN